MSFAGFGAVAEQLRRSTVQVKNGRRGLGSGIIVKSDGLVATNAHVVAPGAAPVTNGSRLSVELWDGSSFPARLKVRNTRRDLALLRIPTMNLTPATLANSDELRVGELVVAVGNPLGFMGAVTTGVVHAIGRRPGLGPTKWIHADVQLAPGNSGGPLADARGNVVGVNTMVVGGLGLAVPSNAVKRLLAGDLQQASLGVAVRAVEVRTSGAERLGLAVLDVVAGSAAEFASLRAGDILVGIEGQDLHSLDDLEGALEGTEERLLRLQFVRGDPNKVRSVAIRLHCPQVAAA
ncbi:MAG TPA: trypsin-like peptidase domain-containing protein [Terriglobia bacterium]|nr:trypsin-like peptidase domain-containing protein [Terriglobia bacterium]